MIINWITGKSFIGKTSYCHHMESIYGDVKCLYIGQEIRKKYGADQIAKENNPVAPAAYDKEIVEMIVSKIEGLKNGCVFTNDTRELFIDGFPRTAKQITDVYDITNRFNDKLNKVYSRIFLIDLIDGRREIPVGMRSDDKELLQKKREREALLVENLLYAYLSMNTFKTSFLNYSNTTKSPNFSDCMVEMRFCQLTKAIQTCNWKEWILDFPVIGGISGLDYLTKRHLMLDDEYTSRYGIGTSVACHTFGVNEYVKMIDDSRCGSCYQHILFVNNMIDRMIEESLELKECFQRKFHDNESIYPPDARNEMVDILHFWLTLAASLGMTYSDIAAIYLAKNRVNQRRIKEGKTEKDCIGVGDLI